MTLASDNKFPKLIITEGSAPSSPAAGDQKLFIDSADHLLKLKNSAGTVTAVGGGLSDPMTTRGDIIIRNSSNTTARLAVGSAGKVLTSDGTDVSWQTPSGGTRAFGLDRASLDGTYGDEFTGGSLDVKWSRHNQISGQETYQAGGLASALKVAHGTSNASEYIYQTAPNGTNETWEASVTWSQETTTGQMFALLMVSSSGTGVATLIYDTSPGLYLANVASHAYSSALSQNTNLVVTGHAYRYGGRVWLRLRKASGVYYASYSFDGQVYSSELSGTPSAFTPARVGIGRILGTNANSIAHWHWFDKTA